MPTIIILIGERGTPLTSFTTETNGGLWTMGRWAVTSPNIGIYIIRIMSGMTEWGNTGVRTGGQIRRAGTVAIMTLIVTPKIIMMEMHAVWEARIPISNGALRKIGGE